MATTTTEGMTLEQAMEIVQTHYLAQQAQAEQPTDTTAVLNPADAADAAIVAQVTKYQTLRDAVKALTKEQENAKTSLLAAFATKEVTAFELNGQVVARRQDVDTPRLDGKALKADLPAIWAAYSKVTSAIRLWVA